MAVTISGKSLSPDSTQEFGSSTEVKTDEELIPVELLEKKPVTEESLTKTFVLMETPMLIVRKGRNLGETHALNRAFPVSIGRSRVCEIRLDDITISGQHCRIIPENGKHVLYDLGSTNGTFLNEKRISKVILKEGDIIKVGETQFLYKVEQHRN
jgi:pSer/pThr/pTyr-binding forkhead associated (FHA) protein